MTNVYTLKIKYVGCGDKIWREAQISSNAFLCDLGYLILASFDTMAYHLFNITYNGVAYELMDEEEDIPEDRCLFYVRLSMLGLTVGDKLNMIYDFGCEQEFEIEVTDIQPMGKGQGRAYPKILSGAGFGIIDDMPAYELLEVIKRIDETGSSGIKYSSGGLFLDRMPDWDYRRFDLKIQNGLLKGEIESIAEGYEEIIEEY